MNKDQTIFGKLRPLSIGMDALIDHVENLCTPGPHKDTNYPPYNIIKTDTNKYTIELAVAGYTKENITLNKNHNKLTITLTQTSQQNPTEYYLWKGITNRPHTKTFLLHENIEITDSTLQNGILQIHLHNPTNQHQQTTNIPIN